MSVAKVASAGANAPNRQHSRCAGRDSRVARDRAAGAARVVSHRGCIVIVWSISRATPDCTGPVPAERPLAPPRVSALGVRSTSASVRSAQRRSPSDAGARTIAPLCGPLDFARGDYLSLRIWDSLLGRCVACRTTCANPCWRRVSDWCAHGGHLLVFDTYFHEPLFAGGLAAKSPIEKRSRGGFAVSAGGLPPACVERTGLPPDRV